MDMEVKQKELIIGAVPATMIELVWNQVEPIIKRAQEKAPDDIRTDVVKEHLIEGTKLLITISRGSDIVAVNVLDVRVLDSGIRVLYIPITAGDEMEEWLSPFLKIAEAIAKDYNCTELRGLAARKGWMSKLQHYGWEEVFTTIRCKIGE